MPKPTVLRGFLAALSLLVILCSGCGTGEYDRRMQELISKGPQAGGGGGGGGGDLLFADPIDLYAGGTASGLKFRMPAVFDSEAQQGTESPPGVTLPGAYSYSKTLGDGKAVIHIACIPAESKKAEDLEKEIVDGLKKVLPGAAWASTSKGGKNWKEIAVTGSQDFGGAEAEGKLQLNLLSTPKYHVVICVRAQTAAAKASNVIQALNASLATVQ